ncbi:MAG: tRNA (adenosine(37)-N6)-threonylcarbamoyltransferase complex transferase subunit TsaD [Eubacteriales bacterium]
MKILAFESSCDETSVAVVDIDEDHRTILSNLVATQIATHALYGGVVPEIASRAHAEAISPLCYGALEQAGVGMDQIDAIAVTACPGLIGALMVGVNFAKALAFAYHKPLIPVNHVKGHAAAAYFENPELKAPFFALIASGGHTSLTYVETPTDFKPVGRTRDDAAGEAFDKSARRLGLPYPGGAEMDRLASLGNPDAIRFPSAALRGSLDFSFSGLKTAVMNYLHTEEQKGNAICREDVAASFTKAVCTSVTTQLAEAYKIYRFDRLVLAGGVAANSHLRAALTDFCGRRGIRLFMPSKGLCGDNAAMIGVQGYFEYCAGHLADSSLTARASSGKSVF